MNIFVAVILEKLHIENIDTPKSIRHFFFLVVEKRKKHLNSIAAHFVTLRHLEVCLDNSNRIFHGEDESMTKYFTLMILNRQMVSLSDNYFAFYLENILYLLEISILLRNMWQKLKLQL